MQNHSSVDRTIASPGPIAISLRATVDSDDGFLRRLRRDSHASEFDLLPIDEAARTLLERLQFDAQASSYRQNHPSSQDFIITDGGRDVGRCWIDDGPDELHLVDIAILPDHQRRGIGSSILAELIQRAESAGVPLRLSVWPGNTAALQLYERIGFRRRRINDASGYLQLEHQTIGAHHV